MQIRFLVRLFITVAFICMLFLILFRDNMTILVLGLIAFSLGLRHGFDADHIVAIDNITRKLSIENKTNHTTGLFFALGHSTIVFILTLAIVLGTISFSGSLGNIGTYGAIFGTIVSALFLWLTALFNIKSLIHIKNGVHHSHTLPKGIISTLGNRVFSIVDRPAKMYIVGFLFGLGFDTATEVALLGMSASATLHGASPWSILYLPILFASGMVLVDSCDSVLVSKMFNWANQDSSRIRKYNIFIIGFTSLSAFIIGLVEVLSLASDYLDTNSIYNSIISFFDNYSESIGLFIFVILIIMWLYGQHKSYRFKTIK